MLFNENNQYSILEFAKKLQGKTLREFLSNNDIESIEKNIEAHPGNKGKLGHHIEKYYFRYPLNSTSEADFPCALELKVTPLRFINNGELRPKERLVCNIINYMNIVELSEPYINEYKDLLEKNMILVITKLKKIIDLFILLQKIMN